MRRRVLAVASVPLPGRVSIFLFGFFDFYCDGRTDDLEEERDHPDTERGESDGPTHQKVKSRGFSDELIVPPYEGAEGNRDREGDSEGSCIEPTGSNVTSDSLEILRLFLLFHLGLNGRGNGRVCHDRRSLIEATCCWPSSS